MCIQIDEVRRSEVRWSDMCFSPFRGAETSIENALLILKSFSFRSTPLVFFDLRDSEHRPFEARIVNLEPRLHLLILEVSFRDGEAGWRRPIRLQEATFRLSMLGDADFKSLKPDWVHLVLSIHYPDRTVVQIGERLQATQGTTVQSKRPLMGSVSSGVKVAV